MRATDDDDGADARITALADAQHGVVTRRQLLGAGLSARQIGLRLERARLHRLYVGVYTPGHTQLGRPGRLLAGAWSAGPRGALFDVAAASVHDLRPNGSAKLDVVLPQRRTWTAQRGIRAHASSTLRPEDVTAVDGIPVTTIARTVVDLAVRHPPRLVERVLDEMVTLGVYDQRALDEQLARHHVRGTRELAAVLTDHAPGATVTKSELEELLLTVCDAHDVPRPRCNAWVAWVEVDAHWPGTPVVAELDSARFHISRAAFERDRAKGNHLVGHGAVLLRFTWRQLAGEAAGVAAQLRRVLSAAS